MSDAHTSVVDWDLLTSYAGLLVLALSAIYAGAHGSLPPARNPDGSKSREELEEEEGQERMGAGDAWLFPVVGSATLVGLYAVVKYFGTAWINWALGAYFSVAGIGAVWKSLIGLTRWAVGEERWLVFDEVEVVVTKGRRDAAKNKFTLSLRTPSLFLLPLALFPSLLYSFYSRSALLTDVLGLAFAHSALSLLKLDSFRTGCILLGGLFIYDVWWVFGTDVMVKVATSLDVPIKLLFPKSLASLLPFSFSLSSPFIVVAAQAPARGYTMLGLGDVVVPGVFVALGLRWDYHRALARGGGFSKPYFWALMGAYAAGLGGTMGVMHVFHRAQPALLYLSPACVGAFAATAAWRGELGSAWGWCDGATEEA
ncbi:peptidase A22B, signal peptide peptidase, partial [Mycena maculata]